MDEAIAQRFAQAIREAWLTGKDFEGEKKQGFFLSMKGSRTVRGGFKDKLYIGNIHRIENHLYWNDEELQEDDQIVDVVVIDGPVTRDGDGCSYGSKDHRDQILYANTIPQVVGHIFIINTPGGASSARIDYEQAIADCREKGKPTVAWVDGLCCSAGQLVAALCDRTVVMNGRHTMGCIGTMCAFWAVPHGNVARDGYRYIELVSVTSPDKNAEYRDAAKGDYEKLQAELNRLGEEFRETVRQNRPLVKEEHLTGKTYDADSVMGALVDEIGDYNRAIECVFELAGQTLTAARLVTAEPAEEDPEEKPTEEPEEMAKLDDQQKQAIANSRGNLMMADDGHVTTEEQGFFGPKTVEVATPKNENTMTEEEKKAAEAQAAEAAAQEAEATAANPVNNDTEEAPADGGATAQEEAPAAEEAVVADSPEAAEQSEEESAGQAEALAAAEAMIAEKDKEIAALKENLATLNGIAEERDKSNAAIAEREVAIETANAAIEEGKVAIAERDKTIAEHVATIAAKDAAIAEKDAAIEKLTKQVAALKGEVKELSEKPTPMVSAESGVPADNSTGEAPKQVHRIQPGMTYEEIRRLKREGMK